MRDFWIRHKYRLVLILHYFSAIAISYWQLLHEWYQAVNTYEVVAKLGSTMQELPRAKDT